MHSSVIVLQELAVSTEKYKIDLYSHATYNVQLVIV